MTTSDLLTLFGALVLPALTGGLAWLLADAKAKARSEATDTKVAELKLAHDATARDVQNLALDARACSQDRTGLHAQVIQIETAKASREAVDGVRNEVAALRSELGSRLDNIEALIREALSGDKRA